MHVSLDNLLITLRKSSLGDLYLITNQEHEAFDLKNSKREEERKGQREPGERREFPRCSLKTAKAGRRGRARGNWGEERRGESSPSVPVACRDANLG